MSLTPLTLLDVLTKAQKTYPAGKVFSITPAIKQHKPVVVVLVASNGKVTELSYNLLEGTLIETHHGRRAIKRVEEKMVDLPRSAQFDPYRLHSTSGASAGL
ncbi:hypothetical protein [Cupriavidus gilardii]|uniref:Uncharacterized protein n=1 Tax=Cupriavidus gilardii TaxID=82541 RepID=A0A849BCY0_9BURK|nr:hypothetical protein [Cupriavidus gilardii]KAB0595312.1 hypothetical protein F7Q96_18605 [Cupriavidus gilardii]NNH11988.1 hypothetical protein [Cupriavidus gilardii]